MASFSLSLVDKVTAPAGQVTGSITKMVQSLKDVVVNGADAGPLMDMVGGSIGGMVGQAFPAGPALSKITEALSALGPEGQAVAAVLQVVVGVLTVVISTLYDWAAAAVECAAQRAALIATFSALGEGANAGAKTLAATEALAAQLPFVTSKVNAWAKSLMAAGLQGAEMEQGVRAIASATAIMGESGGAAAETLIKRFAMAADSGQKVKLDRRILTQLAAAGVSSVALAAALGVPAEKLGTMSIAADKLGDAMQKALVEKGAGALETLGATWPTISAKMSEGITSLFDGAGKAIGPFMTEVQSLFSEFYKGSTTMDAGKGIITAVLTELFNVATKVVHAVHTGFLMLEIGALRIAIAIAPIVLGFKKILSNAMVLQGLKMVLIGLALPFVIIGAVIGALIVGIAMLVGAVVWMATLIAAGFLYVVGVVSTAVGSVVSTLADWATSAYDAAANFISGLVGGIVGGVGAVVGAVKGLASSAISAFSGKMDSHSPSRVMIKQGGNITDGVAVGIDAGVDRVASSAEDMGGAAIDGSAGGMSGGRRGGAARGGGAGPTINIEKGAFTINGAGKDWVEITEEAFALIMERFAASQGLMGAR